MRDEADPGRAWETWRAERDRLFASHAQSPLPEAARAGFGGLSYFPYDPSWRVLATLEATPPEDLRIAASTGEPILFTRFGRARFDRGVERWSLDLFWLEAYGGGLFLPFGDTSSGHDTYGGGRYLLDTVKGADLGGDAEALVLDFNFAYNPSCCYDPRWACPLAPPTNRLQVAVHAGERSPGRF